MGNCSCKNPSKQMHTDVNVEDIPKSFNKSSTEYAQKLIRVKSIKYTGDNLHKITKVADIIENIDKVQLTMNQGMDSKTELTEPNSKKKMVDSIILEYDITEEEQHKLKNALFKHFLFKDMNEEILYN